MGRGPGEALWPTQFPIEVLESARRQLGSAAFASLYQQRPAPIEGRIFKREWWRSYSAVPEKFTRIVLSIDSAFKTGQENDFSAFTVWGETQTDGFYLLHSWRGRVEFPELKRKVREFADQWKPNAVLVEDKASGQSLIQELKNDSNLPIVPVRVDSDKVTRANAITGLVEAGKVLLPERAGWLDDYMDELSSFPSAKNDDLTDSTTQALAYMRKMGSYSGVFEWMRQEAATIGTRKSDASAPEISTLSPPAGSVSGGEILLLTGRNLAGAAIEIGGNMATVNSSTDTEIIFLSPPHAPGAVNIVVKTPGGSSSSMGGYTYSVNDHNARRERGPHAELPPEEPQHAPPADALSREEIQELENQIAELDVMCQDVVP